MPSDAHFLPGLNDLLPTPLMEATRMWGTSSLALGLTSYTDLHLPTPLSDLLLLPTVQL
jgi:hypothetical protein